jgi:uridine kinase
MNKIDLIEYLENKILEINKKRVIIAIDGIDASGKSSLSKEITLKLQNKLYNVQLIHIDDFHLPKKIRYSKGKDSPEGFYFDSYDYQTIISKLIIPFLNEEEIILIKSFDLENDKENIVETKIEENTILIVEGIFLQRKELYKYWDLKIFLDVEFDIAEKRNLLRDLKANPNANKENIIDRFNKRYKSGQKLYFEYEKPQDKADIVIDNNDYNNPKLIPNFSKKCE